MDRTIKRALSAKDLSDVPEAMRIGSPSDASDREVRQWAERGLLHPKTNYGVVYRVAFADLLAELNEVPAAVQHGTAMRFMQVGYFAIEDADNEFMPGIRGIAKPLLDDVDGGWIVVTDRGIRWHLSRDGVPDYRASSNLWETRNVRFSDVLACELDGQNDMLDVLTIVYSVGGGRQGNQFLLGKTQAGVAPENESLRERIISPKRDE